MLLSCVTLEQAYVCQCMQLRCLIMWFICLIVCTFLVVNRRRGITSACDDPSSERCKYIHNMHRMTSLFAAQVIDTLTCSFFYTQQLETSFATADPYSVAASKLFR